MNKLEQLYSAIKQLEELGIPVSQEQLDVIRQAEGEYIDEEIIPLVQTVLCDKLDSIRNAFTINVEFDEQKKVKVSRVGKTLTKNDISTVVTPSKLGGRASNTKKYILRVKFPDGKTICHQKVSETFVEMVMYIGVDKVEALGIEVLGKNIINTELFSTERYRSSQYDVGDGKYLTTAGDTERRMTTMTRISNELNLGLVIEKVTI